MSTIESVIEAIRDYYESEWEEVNEESFSDLSEIGLAYTTGDDGEEIQVSANIPEMRIDRYVNGELSNAWQFTDYEQMAQFIYLTNFDEFAFDDCEDAYKTSVK